MQRDDKGAPSFELLNVLVSVDLVATWAGRAATISAKKPDNVSAFVTVSLRVS